MSIIGTKRAVAMGIAVIMILLICGQVHLTPRHEAKAGATVHRAASIGRGILSGYGKLPLRFESNLGQIQGASNAQVKFMSRGQGYALFLTGADALLNLRAVHAASNDTLQLELLGADPEVHGRGVGEQPSKSNYFIGNDPTHWRSNIPNYAGVQYQGIYPGVDLLYYGNQEQLEYDFIVAPGADPDLIRLGVAAQHADSMQIDPSGDLVVEVQGGKVVFRKPVAYQPDLAAASTIATETGAARQEDARRGRRVEARYRLEGNDRVRFDIGEYDRTLPLVIDPTLSYSSYLGGSQYEQGYGIAVDSAGNAYVTGCTGSPDFPFTSNAYRRQIAGGGDCGDTDGPGDAFVAKINAAGTALVYATYLGGTGGDQGWAIATDAAGNAYVTGKTTSQDFPIIPGAVQSNPGGGHDLFVTKLNPAGSALVYSTYLGGSADDGFYGAAIAVDASGNAYVTGDTASANFPFSVGALQTTCTPCGAGSGASNSFVTKLNATGSALVYSTFLGGSGGGLGDQGRGIAVDASGNAYVAGVAESHNFPTTLGALIPKCPDNAGSMGYVSKLNTTGTALVYSTYLCGSANAAAYAVAVDSSGSAYVTGNSGSSDFPHTPGVYQPNCPSTTPVIPCDSAFVSKLNPDGSALVYSTFLGGTTQESGKGIAVDSSGNAYVIGTTTSVNFPTTLDSFQPKCSGGCLLGDAFVTELNATGTALVYSTLYGGNAAEQGNQIALDPSGNVYIVGTTNSSDLPFTPGVFQPQCGGGCANDDAFVAKISFGSSTVNPVTTTTTLGVSPTAANAGTSVTLSATVTPASGTAVPTGAVAFKDGTNTLGTANLDAAGTATYSTSSLTAGTYSITAAYDGDSGHSPSTSTAVGLTIKAAAAAPAAPTGVTATAGNAQVNLSWTGSSGAATYNIYEGTTPGGESTAAVQTGLTGTSVVIGGLTNGTTYYFTVKAVNANGTSAASSEVTATPTAPATGATGGSHGGKGGVGGDLLIALALLVALRTWRPRELAVWAQGGPSA